VERGERRAAAGAGLAALCNGRRLGGWLFWLGLTGGLGAEPIKSSSIATARSRSTFWSGLAVTPLRRLHGLNLMPFRRAIGVLCFFFVLAHLLVWAVLDVQTLARVWADIVERPYITIGMAGSCAAAAGADVEQLVGPAHGGGRVAASLHKLVYPAAVLGALHYVWLAKGFQLEPLVYMAAILALLALGCGLGADARPRLRERASPPHIWG
jgi:sulfoxide reductase heme-binding subunit YedZ